MVIDNNKTIGDVVANDFRTAGVFSQLGIDFCCKGNRTIDEVCTKKGIDKYVLLDELERVTANINNQEIDFKSWELDLLIDYIEKKHHRYVEEKTPVLLAFLDKLTKVHGTKHPELFEINNLFYQGAGELAQHMKKEELILFPFIKNMVSANKKNTTLEMPGFGSVENPIAMMKHEHENEGERYEKIKALSNNYNPPADACNTYKVTFQMLEEFEQDLHTHIHLENNILFPKAIDLQSKFN